MKKAERQCATVSYNSENFAKEVIQSLHHDRVFALTNLPEELKIAMKQLFESGDDFFDHLHEYAQDEYLGKIEPKNVRGLFGPEKFPLFCNNGARFFVAMNKDGSINNEKMPEYQDRPAMSEASLVFNRYTDAIISRVLESIATEHHLNPNEMKELILGNACVGLTRYYPITQKRAEQLFHHNVLAVTGDEGDQVEQFAQHRDINPVTILCYRGKPDGLIVKDYETKKLLPLLVDCGDEPYLIIFTGTPLKEMTNGNIRALQHRVVTSPDKQHTEAKMDSCQWRFTLAKFTYFNGDQIEPLKKTDGEIIQPPKPRKHHREYPISQEKFFMDHLATDEAIREKSKVREFPFEIAQRYPTNVKCEEMYVAQLGNDSIGACKK